MTKKIYKERSQTTIKYLSIVIIVIGSIFLANGLILAWTAPGSAPPDGNVDAPLTGTLGTSGQWCTTDGSQVNCTTDAPSVGGVDTLQTVTDRGASTNQNLSIGGLTVADNFSATIGAADFYLGYSGRRGSPGRALVDLGSTLAINYGPDWSGVETHGSLSVSSDLTVGGTIRSTKWSIAAPRWDTSFYVAQSQHYYGHNSTHTIYLGESGNTVSLRGTLNVGGNISLRGTLNVGGSISLGTNQTIYGSNRMHVYSSELLYLLNGSGVVIGKEWGGSGDLSVQGEIGVGSTGHSYQPSGGNWDYTLLLNGSNYTSIGFHDAGHSVNSLRYYASNFYIGYNDGWGTANLNVGGGLTVGSNLTVGGKITASEGTALYKCPSYNWYGCPSWCTGQLGLDSTCNYKHDVGWGGGGCGAIGSKNCTFLGRLLSP